jgi:NOL1/NOP2/fmu family ribosome biogenesis protein
MIILSALPEGSLLVANEVNHSRWNILQHNLDKWGHPNIVSMSKDPSRIPWQEQFDLILVDAPCSGEGLFRKDHDARAQWSPEHVALCSARQRRILHEAARLLKPGGQLIYSTCTFNTDENMNQVLWLANTYRLESGNVALPSDWNVVVVEQQGHTGYQFLSHKVRGEGFFCAILVKPDLRGAIPNPTARRRSTSKQKDIVLERPDWLQVGIDAPDIWLRPSSHQSLSILRTSINPDFLDTVSGLRFGTEFGKGQGRAYTPAHALALSLLLNPEVPGIELDEAEAVSFLRKEALQHEPSENGWYVVRYNGYPLGWAKQTGAGWKNYLPTHLRIRKA